MNGVVIGYVKINNMLVFLVFLIAIILGFKFYPSLTKLILIIGILGFIIIIIIALIGNAFTNKKSVPELNPQANEPTWAQPTQQENPNATWHTVYNYSNNISTSTNSFNIQGNKWEIIYSINDPTHGSGVLSTYLDGNIPLILQVGSATNMRKQVYGSGSHYISIDDTNDVYYTIEVLDYY